MRYFLLITILLTGCIANYKIPSNKYEDKLISTTKNPDGTTTYKFYRHSLEYVDTAKRHKLLNRKVYKDNHIVYRYPIIKSDIEPTRFYLKSGKNHLTKEGDTVMFVNDDLPEMNRHFWGRGVMLHRITENCYLIKPATNNMRYAKFYISITHNYEEIENDKGFIADSLILPVK